MNADVILFILGLVFVILAAIIGLFRNFLLVPVCCMVSISFIVASAVLKEDRNTATTQPTATAPAYQEVTISELVENHQKFAGKYVSVTGQIRGGARGEIFSLVNRTNDYISWVMGSGEVPSGEIERYMKRKKEYPFVQLKGMVSLVPSTGSYVGVFVVASDCRIIDQGPASIPASSSPTQVK